MTPSATAGDAGRGAVAAIKRVLRFALVGGAATLLYALIATLAHGHVAAPAAVISLGAYVFAALLSYYGHRVFTFRTQRRHEDTAPRFAATAFIGYALAALVPAILTDVLGFSPHLSTALICTAIPGLNFLLLSRFVFGEPHESVGKPSRDQFNA